MQHYYSYHHSHAYNSKHDIVSLLRLVFSDPRVSFNPRSPNDSFLWHSPPGAPGSRRPRDNVYISKHHDHLHLTVLPFASPAVTNDYLPDYVALSRTRYLLDVDDESDKGVEHLAARAKLSCRVFSVENHPFPKEIVSNADDDWRLGSCGIGIRVSQRAQGAFFLTNRVCTNGSW